MLSSMTGTEYQTVDVDDDVDDYEQDSLKCWDCNVNFTSEYYLKKHLLHHIKQPWVLLTRIQEPIKITLKSRRNNSFEIISSPTGFNLSSPSPNENLSESETYGEGPEQDEEDQDDSVSDSKENLAEGLDVPAESSEADGLVHISFSPNFAEENGGDAGDNSNDSSASNQNEEETKHDITQEYGNIPGAEPTPPPEPSPEYPKIRIKSSGLLMKEPLTITEITDDNPNGDVRPEIIELSNNGDNNAYGNAAEDSIWATPSLEDPLRLPDASDSDGSLISSLFSNNNDRAKDLGFTSSESEFISLDRFDDRNRSALQVYSSSAASGLAQNPLDTLAGLPMQQLAEQVSRLQPSAGGQMHQQNVLINIQQFQQPPPPQAHAYQPPPMYPHPGVPAQPMYHQPYQYQPPNPMYYPPAPGYPPPMPPPPRPPMSQPQMPQPPPQQMGQPMTSMAQPYRPSVPPRPSMAPRQPMQPQRGQTSPRQPMNPRQPPMMPRQRAPMVRPRGPMPMGMRGGPRPRMNGPNTNQQMPQGQQGPRMVKRSPEQMQTIQMKRKRMDVLMPDKHDDADCQVIAVQPKNTGLPQIQSIQGNAPEPGDNSVMHLSDSITLSVRNPPARPVSPKKSDAKAVANILATRGITVTAAPKPKKADTPPKKNSPPPVAINLNSAVSIIPASKTMPNTKSSNSGERLPTVDLTDDTVSESASASPIKTVPTKPPTQTQKVLPFQCDLCPAKYPNSLSLNKHRQSFHKTGGLTEFGIPLIDLKQPGLVQRLTTFGIYNYIPLPGASADTTFALPIISASNRSATGNLGNMGVSSILTLGPIRSLPKPVQNHNNTSK